MTDDQQSNQFHRLDPVYPIGHRVHHRIGGQFLGHDRVRVLFGGLFGVFDSFFPG
ncbi:MAG: hypothetical protein ACPGRD_01230 [Planktomarina sp.]